MPVYIISLFVLHLYTVYIYIYMCVCLCVYIYIYIIVYMLRSLYISIPASMNLYVKFLCLFSFLNRCELVAMANGHSVHTVKVTSKKCYFFY